MLIIGGSIHIIDVMATPKPASIDPRVSTAVFGAIGAASLFVLSSVVAMAALLAYVLLVYAATGARAAGGSAGPAGGLRALGRNVAGLSWVIVLILLLNGLLVAGDPLVAIGGRTVLTRQGMEAGVFFCMRLLVLYVAMVAYLAVTPAAEFARGVYSLLRPVSTKLANGAAFYGFLVLSFVPLFAEEFERVRLAQMFRGADFKGGILRRAGAARALVVPLLVSAIHRSEQLAVVVELRGLRDRVGAALPARRPGAADAALAAATVGILVAIALVLDTGHY